jgi:GT2 family glycosyltransferase
LTARVTVIILNWNGKQFLERCLQSLLTQTFQDFEIVLVDNGSKDGSVSFLEEHYPQVRLITNQENQGFAAANNQAIRATDSEFVATLNNDTEVTPNWLGELVRAADMADNRIGAYASKMLFTYRAGMIQSAGIALDRAGIAWDWRGGEEDDRTEEESVEIFGASAGAALYRRSMLHEIGLFDEAFFAYLEDVDLAWRAQWAGWKALFVPTARVLHFHSGTGKEGSYFKNWHLGRNKIWVVAKNYPWPQMLWYLPIVLLYDLASIPYTLIWRGDWGPVLGRLAGLARLSTAWKAHQAECPLRQISGQQMVARMAPLVSPWVLWRRYAHLRREWPKEANRLTNTASCRTRTKES